MFDSVRRHRRQPTRLPSLGFSRQEHWSGLPFPCPMHESEKWKWSRSVVSNSSDTMYCSRPGSSAHGIFLGESTGVGCHCLLRGLQLLCSKELCWVSPYFLAWKPYNLVISWAIEVSVICNETIRLDEFMLKKWWVCKQDDSGWGLVPSERTTTWLEVWSSEPGDVSLTSGCPMGPGICV